MSRFPREYAESTLKRRYNKLELAQDLVELLHCYFEAFGNFYQILTIKDAFDIFERHNRGILSFDKFVDFSDIVRHERHYYYVLGLEELYSNELKSEPCDRIIVHESLVEFDCEEYYKMEEAQHNKPLYIPAKAELLRYADDFYCPETKEYLALKHFFCSKLKKSESEADDLCGECYMVITCDNEDPFEVIFNDFERMGVNIPEAHLEEFCNKFQDYCNNTRIPYNRGFTPNELHRRLSVDNSAINITFGQNLKDMIQRGEINASDLTLSLMNTDISIDVRERLINDISMSVHGQEKIGRNQPCPCGSGKKYKRCCGK